MSPPLRVGINAIFLEPGMGGIESYVLQLLPALREADPELRMTVLCNRKGRSLLAAQFSDLDIQLVTPRGTSRGLRALFELGPLGLLASHRFDVVHSPALTAPLFTRAANVVVLADTTWITVPDLGQGQAATTRLWQVVVPWVARRADRVVTYTTAAARDVERHLGVEGDRIDVVPLGYRPQSGVPPTAEAELRSRLALGEGPLVLNVGMKKVHKNQLRLIQAIPAVRRAVPGTEIVLPGPPTPYERELRTQAERLGIAAAVHFPGYVDEADLEGLYAAASVFALPSLNEGFGLPLLEAMGRGVPVVTSNVSALPEVAGEAALLVDPTSVEAMAEAVVQVLLDDSLRERMVAAGRQRSASFTWERAARETLASWRRAQEYRR